MIDASLRSSEGQQLIGKVAQAFNIDEHKASTAVRTLADELDARIQRNMLSRGGVADVASLVTNPSAGKALSDPDALASPVAAESGNHILDVLIGNKHISRKIAARAATQADLGADTTEKLLPAVASLMIAELQRQSQPALEKLVGNAPGLVGAGGSPLSLPGETQPTGSPSSDWRSGNGSAYSAPQTAPGKPIDAGQPLPIPGDNIPGIGRSRSPQYQEPDNPYDRLPDIIRRGGQQAPGGGGSLEDVIRSIFGSVLGSNRGVIGTIIQLFLIRWLASLARRILSRVFTGR